jgi:hypothetical protein
MRTMTVVVVSALVLLFLGSLFVGRKVFSSYERNLNQQLTQAEKASPETAQAVRKSVYYRKARLAMSSFDLVGGLTTRDLENIPNYNRLFPFVYLIACLWLVFGLRRPKRD